MRLGFECISDVKWPSATETVAWKQQVGTRRVQPLPITHALSAVCNTTTLGLLRAWHASAHGESAACVERLYEQDFALFDVRAAQRQLAAAYNVPLSHALLHAQAGSVVATLSLAAVDAGELTSLRVRVESVSDQALSLALGAAVHRSAARYRER